MAERMPSWLAGQLLDSIPAGPVEVGLYTGPPDGLPHVQLPPGFRHGVTMAEAIEGADLLADVLRDMGASLTAEAKARTPIVPPTWMREPRREGDTADG